MLPDGTMFLVEIGILNPRYVDRPIVLLILDNQTDNYCVFEKLVIKKNFVPDYHHY
jgi:hypothetical protein